jgi:hypothetical protein
MSLCRAAVIWPLLLSNYVVGLTDVQVCICDGARARINDPLDLH